jgi:hypothetical protein
MANLQVGSDCTQGINLNTTTAYTMYRLPTGTRGSAGFDAKGSLLYDTNDKNIVVLDTNGNWYRVDMVNFTAL